ncbi:hypothetical protein ROBYS_40160 [Roseobacter sp. OBYS 0001]|nr:hypothetical protein ROBYS_40160 [Roseobacter sp. OBYS 0001]
MVRFRARLSRVTVIWIKQQAEQSDSPGQTSWPKRCKIFYGSEQFQIARHLTSVSPLRKFEVDFLIVRQTRQA